MSTVKKLVTIVCICVLSITCVLSYVEAGSFVCGNSVRPCVNTSIQGGTVTNTQTTGAATTAVTVTMAAVTGGRNVIHQIEARCNTGAATSGLTVTDGGVTIWSTVLTEVLAANNFVRSFSPPLTSALTSALVITLAACTAGTGTLIVQSDRY